MKKKREKNNKTTSVKFRCTEQEKKDLKRLAKSRGDSLSDLCRGSVFNDKVVLANPIELIKTLDAIGAELNKSGSNINQIAKYANKLDKGGKLDSNVLQAFLNIMEEHQELKKQIIVGYQNLISKV